MTNMVTRAAVAVLALGALTGAASAADLRRPAPAPAPQPYAGDIVSYGFNWSGAYIGVNAGYRWVDDWVRRDVGSNFNLDSSSFAGGLQVGYLFQTGPLVYGLEGDVTFGDNDKSRTLGGGQTIRTEMDWSGSARARIGYAVDRVLVYGTGGVAFANVDITGASAGVDTKNETLVGWTVGAGLEYALTNNMSLRGEYLYSDFGTTSVGFPSSGLAAQRQDVNSHLARLGVNFKF